MCVERTWLLFSYAKISCAARNRIQYGTKHIRIKSVKEVRADLDNGRKTRNLITST